MTKYVFDASVFLTALLNKTSNVSSQIESLLKDALSQKCEIYVTPLFIYEFTNGLRFSINNPALAEEVFEKFRLLPIKTFQLQENHLSSILRLAFEQNTTVYDTSYDVTASLLNAVFYTCDKKYYDRAKNKQSIKLLI